MKSKFEQLTKGETIFKGLNELPTDPAASTELALTLHEQEPKLMFGLRECRKSPPSLFSYSFLTVLVVKRCVHRLRPHKTSLFVLNRHITKDFLTAEPCIATGLRFAPQEDDFFVHPASKQGHQQQPHAVDFPVCLLWDNDCEFPLWIPCPSKSHSCTC